MSLCISGNATIGPSSFSRSSVASTSPLATAMSLADRLPVAATGGKRMGFCASGVGVLCIRGRGLCIRGRGFEG